MMFKMGILSKMGLYTQVWAKSRNLRPIRCFQTSVSSLNSENSMNVFDRRTKQMQMERAAKAPDVSNFDFLKEEIGYRLADRVLDIKRQMGHCVDLGSGRGFVTRHLTNHSITEKVTALEMSEEMLEQCQMPSEEEGLSCEKICLDMDNCELPFDKDSVDIVTTCLSMHWVNNLPGLLSEVNRMLKPDGVFIGCMFGGETLFELRSSLQMSELERLGGIGQHVSPFVQVQDLGSLLNRSGFKMLTIDTDEVRVNYPTIFEVMRDLKGMAENNAAWNRKANIGKDVLISTEAIYQELYGNEDGTLPVTFQIFFWIGWKASPLQPKPLTPQTSDVSLKDLERLDEVVKEKKKDKE